MCGRISILIFWLVSFGVFIEIMFFFWFFVIIDDFCFFVGFRFFAFFWEFFLLFFFGFIFSIIRSFWLVFILDFYIFVLFLDLCFDFFFFYYYIGFIVFIIGGNIFVIISICIIGWGIYFVRGDRGCIGRGIYWFIIFYVFLDIISCGILIVLVVRWLFGIVRLSICRDRYLNICGGVLRFWRVIFY